MLNKKISTKGKEMKKIFGTIVICLLLSGCSLLKIASAPFKSTVSNVPQSKIEEKSLIKCDGTISITKDGTVSCSRGYYANSQNSNIQERVLSIKEKIIQFFNKLAGFSFWGVILLVFLCPSLIGLIAGRLFEGVYGVGITAFRQVSTAIQKVKTDAPSLITALEVSTDEKIKEWIADFKKKNGIK